MTLQQAIVKYITPGGQYCDFNSTARCKFCIEIKKRGTPTRHYCTLFDNELSTSSGGVEKTVLCRENWKRNTIIESTEQLPCSADLSPRGVIKLVRSALKDVQKLAKSLYREGFPWEDAYDLAIDDISERYKDEIV